MFLEEAPFLDKLRAHVLVCFFLLGFFCVLCVLLFFCVVWFIFDFGTRGADLSPLPPPPLFFFFFSSVEPFSLRELTSGPHHIFSGLYLPSFYFEKMQICGPLPLLFNLKEVLLSS